jgi:hypothetical protein
MCKEGYCEFFFYIYWKVIATITSMILFNLFFSILNLFYSYRRIVQYKTAYYSFYLPVSLYE